ncbi:Uncharacterised protein [Bordetella pertussis]|nr:Uncharacterised protein [Bordetella pertussis]
MPPRSAISTFRSAAASAARSSTARISTCRNWAMWSPTRPCMRSWNRRCRTAALRSCPARLPASTARMAKA